MVTINYETIQFLKRPRTLLLIALVIISIASVAVFGLQEGLDLQGGSMINLHLSEPVDQETMNTVTAILDKRLNAFGISDVKVRQSGSQDVIVEIAGVKPEQVEKIISTPGKFEAKINGQTAITGADISSVSGSFSNCERSSLFSCFDKLFVSIIDYSPCIKLSKFLINAVPLSIKLLKFGSSFIKYLRALRIKTSLRMYSTFFKFLPSNGCLCHI